MNVFKGGFSRDRKNNFFGFSLVSLGIFVYLILKSDTKEYYDASSYISLSQIFIDNGIFNFKAFGLKNDFIRGYAFPWLLAVLRQGENMQYWWWFWTACMTSGLCTIALPEIAEKKFGKKINSHKKLVLAILFVWFYSGTILYALSDMWAVGCAIWGVTCLIWAENSKVCKKIVIYILAGTLLGIAYNIRTIYIFVLLGIVIKQILEITFQSKKRSKTMLMIVLLFGMLISAIPQMVVNHYQHDRITPQVITGGGGGLFKDQLYWGMWMQKYETYVGGDRPAAVRYEDLIGKEILEKYETKPQTMGNYFKMVMKHPLDFAGIYFRHIVNLIDMRYPEIYIKQFRPTLIFSLVNYTLLYMFFVSLLVKIGFQNIGFKEIIQKGAYIIVLLLPTVTIIPGAVETRFAIMFHLLIFTWLLAEVKWRQFKELNIQRKILFALGLVAFLACMSAITGGTQVMAEGARGLY